MRKIVFTLLLISALSIPAFATVIRPTYLEEKYQTQIAYDGSNNPEYVGKSLEPCADNEACWQIFKITYSGANPTNIQFCNGTHAFVAVWDNRSSGCSYS